MPNSCNALIIFAKYGFNILLSLALALETVPAKFAERLKYVTNIVNTFCNSSFDQDIISTIQTVYKDIYKSCFVKNSFDNEILWKCTKKYQEPYNAFLVPPVSYCIQSNCHGEIYFHYQSKVLLHTLQGPIPGQKATLRCRECNCIYNVDSFSSPKEGKRFYPFPVEWIAASNRVYFSRELHEFLCESVNHAFVSHQAFSEIYNSVFSYPVATEDELKTVWKMFDGASANDDLDYSDTNQKDVRINLNSEIQGSNGSSGQDMTRKQATNAYFNGELVNELKERNVLTTTVLSKQNTREDIMKDIDSMRRNELYPHDESDCSEKCQEKGCKNLRVIDCCWKVCMPHCMFAVENEVHGYPLINFPNVCTNEPMANSVFCKDHHQFLKSNNIPTKKEEFLKHIGCKANPTTDADIKTVDININDLAKITKLQQNIGISATSYHRTTSIIKNSKSSTWGDGKPRSNCNKNTGEKARLRQRSRGHFISVTGGGHIQCFNPIFKSESPCQILMLVIRTIYLEFKDKPQEEQEKALDNYILAYDNMCHLDSLKAVEGDLPLPPPLNTMWKRIKKVIDRLHIQNHKDKKCKEQYNPSSIPEEYNTMIAEQTFAWFSRSFKKNVNSMTQTHHLFFIHRNIIRRNRYSTVMRKKGKEPLLPGVTYKTGI